MATEELFNKLKLVAPGTKLRKALDDIVMANFGALILLVDDIEANKNLIQSGFMLDTNFIPEKLYELAKMDGAIILNEDVSKILVANAHLVPDITIPTSATGIRHRTAERIANQIGKMVIVVSERRQVVTVYYKNRKYQINDISVLNIKVNQALATLEKYRQNFDKKLFQINPEELADRANLRDIAEIVIKGVELLNISDEIEPYVIELGVEGRLTTMQVQEITDNVEQLLTMFIMDYHRENLDEDKSREALTNIKDLKEPGPLVIARALGYEIANVVQLDETGVTPRGYRILKCVARIPMTIAHHVVKAFHDISQLKMTDVNALMQVEGIGEKRAHAILSSVYSRTPQ